MAHLRRARLCDAAAKVREDGTRVAPGDYRTRPRSALVPLLRATEAVEQFYSINERRVRGAKEWKEYLETALLREDLNRILTYVETGEERSEEDGSGAADSPDLPRLPDLPLSAVPEPMLPELCDRVNRILDRLNDPRLTLVQIAVIRTRPIFEWKNELEKWSVDPVDPDVFLATAAHYEQHPGAATMRALAESITRLSCSRSDSCRQLGAAAREVYHKANIKIFVSEVLINHFLPKQDVRHTNFRGIIANQPVTARGLNESELKINMVPNPDSLLFSLDISGKVASKSRSNAWISTLFSDNVANYSGRKKMAWTEKGVELAPTAVAVTGSRVRLQGIRTEIDSIPVFSGLVREIIRGQFEARSDQIRRESRQRVTREVRTQIDKETEERFGTINQQYRDSVVRPLENMGLSLESKGSATDEYWLLSSWQLAGRGVLGGHTEAPVTREGSFADLKVHESALAAFFQRLELDGKSMSIGELRRLIGEKVGRPELFGPAEHDAAEITFSDSDPILVRFIDGKIELRLAIAMLKVEDRIFNDFGVHVRYEPRRDDAGRTVLARSGIVRFTGSNIKIGQRMIFGKIFPEQRPIDLQPALFEDDIRFQGLATGACRIENGWFALALVADETAPLARRESGSVTH